MKKNKFITTYILPITLVLSLFSHKSKAQDFHLSQMDAFSQYLNPAMTGMFNGIFRANLNVRNQWASVIQNPFITTGLGFDVHTLDRLSKARPYLKDIKTGAYIVNYRAGTSNYNIFNIVLSAAKDHTYRKTKHHFAYGVQLGIINKSVNLNNLVFDEQYSNADGGSFDPNLGNGESFENTNAIMPEINAGGMYYFADKKSRLNPYIGLSIFHLTQPKETFLNSFRSKLARRYNIHGGTKININKKHQFSVFAIAQQQANNKELTGTILGAYFINPLKRIALLYGYSVRASNDFIDVTRSIDDSVVHLGLKYGDVTGRVSYDINTSELARFSENRGGFEFSLVYTRSHSSVTVPVGCPRI